MVWSTLQAREFWALVRLQHGVVSRAQLLKRGVSRRAIDHRLKAGRLRAVYRGIYVVGRPELSREGRWMAAVLACGPGALLSDGSGAELLGFGKEWGGLIDVSVPGKRAPRHHGIRVHRRRNLKPADRVIENGIPVTGPVRTLLDLATRLSQRQLEAAINEADKRDVIDPEALRRALVDRGGEPGVAIVRALLDRATFTLTDSELERRFIPLAIAAGLSRPVTQLRVNGFKVDFYWPDLGLVVETDGLRYHRTPTQQVQDQRRDQAHTVAGLTSLRFTHAQVRYEPDYVQATLARVARRITSGA